MMPKTNGRRGPRAFKRPYTPPTLMAHGDLRKLTQAKGSIFNDGPDKPRTRQLFSSSG